MEGRRAAIGGAVANDSDAIFSRPPSALSIREPEHQMTPTQQLTNMSTHSSLNSSDGGLAASAVSRHDSRPATWCNDELSPGETSIRKHHGGQSAANNQHCHDDNGGEQHAPAAKSEGLVVFKQRAADDEDHHMDELECTETDAIMTSLEQDDGDDNSNDDDDNDSVEEYCSLAGLLTEDRISSTSDCMDVDGHSDSSLQRQKWIHAIQNESFQPKPTAFSPLGSIEEDPLLGQQRQCLDKLDALAHVRSRVRFFPLATTAQAVENTRPLSSKVDLSMKIQTRMILSKLEDESGRALQHDEADEDYYESIGIEALSGLESLFFLYLTHKELIRVSEVCRSWKGMARHNLIWEPMLFTPFERYPLRELLGLGKDLPAMQVFMVFKRLRLNELPRDADTRSSGEPRRHQPFHRGRVVEERERLRAWLRAQEDRVANGHNERTRPLFRQSDRTRLAAQILPMQSIQLVRFRGERESSAAAADTDAGDWSVGGGNLQSQFPVLFGNMRARTEREEDEIHFVKDGYRRLSLRSWLLQQQKVSEHTLRSFLRQMLLAIHALEQAGVLHADISTTSILVLERAYKHSDDSLDDDEQKGKSKGHTTPIFQLHCSLNTWYVGNLPELHPLVVAGANPFARGLPQQQQNHHPDRHERRFEDEIAHMRRRDGERLEMFADLEDMEDNNDDLEEFAQQAFQQQRLHPPCMLNSLLRCAISVWARGRFLDSHQNTNMPLLTLLITLHARIPAGLRSFVEFAKFLMLSNTTSAARMLEHVYVADPLSKMKAIPIRPIQPQDVVDYQANILAWYGSAQAASARSTRREAKRSSLSDGRAPVSIHELMPRTTMGSAYFLHALEEANLPRERFVSIVAPVIKSSSWIRKVAETQSHTLQRLDLSNVQLPTSVLLKELSNLPRLTHLRLPVNIERPDDLEHFLAALSCTDLLPNLRAMDENVKLAMDRIEKTYVDQLGMVEFLLGR